MTGLAGTSIFCSWSGGKDCSLALHEAIQGGARPVALVNMLSEDETRSRSHGLHRSVLEAQARALGLPMIFGAATWDDYEDAFAECFLEAKSLGASAGIYGDIHLEEHPDWTDAKNWAESASARAGLEAHFPIWELTTARVVRAQLDAGFKSMIVSVRDGVLSPELLGKILDDELLSQIADTGADVAGEIGEYHTLVVDGPIFRNPLRVSPGERQLRDGVWFLDLSVADQT